MVGDMEGFLRENHVKMIDKYSIYLLKNIM